MFLFLESSIRREEEISLFDHTSESARVDRVTGRRAARASWRPATTTTIATKTSKSKSKSNRALTPKHRRLASAQDHQQTREELLNRVHALKTELQDWRYKMDNQVKNYKGELASLKETLSSEVQALRKELEETSDRLKRSIVSTSSVSTGHSPGLHRLPPP